MLILYWAKINASCSKTQCSLKSSTLPPSTCAPPPPPPPCCLKKMQCSFINPVVPHGIASYFVCCMFFFLLFFIANYVDPASSRSSLDCRHQCGMNATSLNRMQRAYAAIFIAKRSKWCSVCNTHRVFKLLGKSLIRLRVCAGRSEPLLVAHTTLLLVCTVCEVPFWASTILYL